MAEEKLHLGNEIRRVLRKNELSQLLGFYKSTGIGPQRLLKDRKDRPKGLNSTTIYQWMDGKVKTAKSDHLEWVLEAWRSIEPLEPFTEDDLAKLDDELSRTGYGPQSLLRRLSPVPDGITPDILHRLRSKRLKKLPSTHKTFLFEGLASIPDR